MRQDMDRAVENLNRAIDERDELIADLLAHARSMSERLEEAHAEAQRRLPITVALAFMAVAALGLFVLRVLHDGP